MTTNRNQRNKKFELLKSRSNVVDEKQTVISKFFSSSRNKTQPDRCEVLTIDDDELQSDEGASQPNKRRADEPDKLSTKRQRLETAEFPSTSDSSTEDTEIVRRAKLKLKTFCASDTDHLSQNIDTLSFDFTLLKSKLGKALFDLDNKNEASGPNENFPSNGTVNIESSDGNHDYVNLTEDEAEDLENPQGKPDKLSKFASKKRPVKESKSKKNAAAAKSLVKYTPLEQQVIEFKEKYKDTVLLIECGYKFRFFGQDAEIAAKVLKIFAHPDHNFLTASIPVHRLFAHVSRLVAAGYKVGVVRQTETAALKAAGNNKNAPFTRQLSALYTKSTLIGEDVELTAGSDGEGAEPVTMGGAGYLMCISEQEPPKADKGTQIGLIAVQPSTGDVIYDTFLDTSQRSELETRLFHLQPVEVILSSDVSMATQKLLNGIQTVSTRGDDRMRIERMDASIYSYSNAFTRVSQFCKNLTDSDNVQFIINLPQPVICCLAALITYLEDFKLEKILTEVSNFSQFTTATSYMQLDSCTVRNLEIFHNVTNFGEKGSLYWVLNQTVTPGGARLLRSWLSKPLLSYRDIIQRQEVISNIIDGNFPDVQKLRVSLSRLPDLERRLTAAYHQKCSPSDFCSMCEALLTICEKFQHQKEAACHVTSDLLRSILQEIPQLLSDVMEILDMIDSKSAKENDKAAMFIDDTAFPAVCECKDRIKAITQEIQDHRRYIRLTTKQPSLEFTTVQGTEFLIEVKNSNLLFVPKDWTKISSTKTVSRFHSPLIVEKYKLLQQAREQLLIEANKAWIHFLNEFSGRYQQYRKAVGYVSTLDCLMSLAVVAQQHGYTRPVIVEDEVCIEITEGRHPVVHELLGEDKQYVANDTHLNTTGQHVMVITGPNMGGKSCYIRQVALISLLAQTGSYVPAQAARLGILDAIYTRMGAADDIYKGRSTFMVELQEAAEIMAKVTSRSLVILDELGRGTSTHDGVAIAHATLDFFIREPKCLTLFVTHYPSMAEYETRYLDIVGNFHMSFMLNDTESDNEHTDKITFLYELVKGGAGRSYGLNVARLANIPENIIKKAAEKSQEMEENEIHHRSRQEVFLKLCRHKDLTVLKQLNKNFNKKELG